MLKENSSFWRHARTVIFHFRQGSTVCLFLLVTLMAASCRQQGASVSVAEANIAFLGETEYDFGDYSTQDTLVHYFVYKNTGRSARSLWRLVVRTASE